MANNQFMEPGCTITNKKYPPFSCTKPLYPNNPWMCVYTVKTIARFAEAQTMLLCIQDFLQKKKKILRVAGKCVQNLLHIVEINKWTHLLVSSFLNGAVYVGGHAVKLVTALPKKKKKKKLNLEEVYHFCK